MSSYIDTTNPQDLTMDSVNWYQTRRHQYHDKSICMVDNLHDFILSRAIPKYDKANLKIQRL